MQKKQRCHSITVLPLEVTYNVEKIVQTALASFIWLLLRPLYPSYRATKITTCGGDEIWLEC